MARLPSRPRRRGTAPKGLLRPELPPLLNDESGRFLLRRVASVATTDAERRLYRAIVRHAYEDVLPLQSLYDEVEGVFADDPLAVAQFRDKLDDAINRLPEPRTGGGMPPEGEGWPGSAGGWPSGATPGTDLRSFIPNPDGPFPSPCGGEIGPFVDPMGIAWISAAVDRVSGGDEGWYRAAIAGVDAMWRATDTIDVLHRDASHGVDRRGRDALRDRLEQLDRGTRPGRYDAPGGFYGPRGPQGPPPGGFGEDGYPVPDGTTYPPPDDWPPIPNQDDDVPINWPPKGGGGGRIPPRRTFDPCELMLDICRHLVLGGARGLRPNRLPTSTYATGITSISPVTACVGETITLHGSFPATRPADVIVMIGGLPATIVSWSATAIVIRVPSGATSGCVGFRNERVEVSNQQEWQRQQDSVAAVSEGLNCLGIHHAFEPMPFVAARPPCTPFNYFAGTIPEIDYFRVNGETSLRVEPGVPLTLTWAVRNATTIRIRRTSANGPALNVTNPAGNSINLGPFTENQPVDATYQLSAVNRCGTVTATVSVRLRRIPRLVLEGMEVTQGIQQFWRTGIIPNSVATVANKDTIVRVYISTDLGGFMNNRLPQVTGTLTVGGTTLNPINGTAPGAAGGNPFITIGLRAAINRATPNDTLNFRIPAALASGTRGLTVRVQSPTIDGITPRASQTMSWTWETQPALRVRYVRITDSRPAPLGTGTTPTDAQARFTIDRAFDLLPSPPTDIAAARTAVWNTTRRFDLFPNGLDFLLADLEDNHNCSAWEWLWAWTGATQCPDADNALWLGLTSPFNRGLAYTPGNTGIAAMHTVAQTQSAIQRTTPAHEMSHNLNFLHVNVACGTGTIGGPFYAHPNGGTLLDVPFDPFYNVALGGAVNDYMTYGCTVWTSEDSWNRLRATI